MVAMGSGEFDAWTVSEPETCCGLPRSSDEAISTGASVISGMSVRVVEMARG